MSDDDHTPTRRVKSKPKAPEIASVTPIRRQRTAENARRGRPNSAKALDVEERRRIVMNLARLGQSRAEIASWMHQNRPGLVGPSYDDREVLRDVTLYRETVRVETVTEWLDNELDLLRVTQGVAVSKMTSTALSAMENIAGAHLLLRVIEQRQRLVGPQQVAESNTMQEWVSVDTEPAELYRRAFDVLDAKLPREEPPAIEGTFTTS